MKYTSINMNIALCALMSLHGATSASVAPSAPIVVIATTPSFASKVSTSLKSFATDMKTSGSEFLTHVPVAMVSSWATKGLINAYFEYNGYTAQINVLLYEERALHTEVLAALARPITAEQQQAFADRLQVIVNQVPEVSWIYRYLLGLAFHATFTTVLNKVVNRFNPDARCAWAALFTQKVSDELVDNLAMKSEETWSGIMATLQTELNALHRLIRDLPCCN
jgi:hypothetical protein